MSDPTWQHLLDPTAAPLPKAWLWPALVIGALVTLGGCWLAARQLRAFGPPAGAVPRDATPLAAILGVIALMAPMFLISPDRPLAAGIVLIGIGGGCVAVLATLGDAKFIRLRPAHLLRTICLWMSMVPVLLACVLASVAAVMLMGGEVAPQPQVNELRSGSGATWYLGWYVLAGVAAPLREEFIFRLVLYGCIVAWLARGDSWRDPGRVAALLISVIAFVALHGNWVIGFAPLAVLAWVLTALYAHTGSLWPPVLLHALHNALVITVHVTLGGTS